MNPNGELDELLIAEVQHHAVVYNRQKYFLKVASAKCESREDAWKDISKKMGTDVEFCKKRWKYLRERYVQRRKEQTDSPSYEHLSRPYLEKMKFLDDHIQPRRSYRNATNMLSPLSNGPFIELPDSSKSNECSNGLAFHKFNNDFSLIKSEPEQPFHDLSANNHLTSTAKHKQNSPSNSESLHRPQVDFRNYNIPSSPSSVKSPGFSSSTEPAEFNNSSQSKRSRVELPSENTDDGDSSNTEEPQSSKFNTVRNNHKRNHNDSNDFLYSIYQQFPGNGQIRTTEHIFGELVASELLKMSKDRRRYTQKKILQVLFFDD